jgi:hypothetical protein
MSKYGPLETFLRDRAVAELDMTFADIEAVLGAKLPRSAWGRQWWANEASQVSTHVQCRAWQSAGYSARPRIAEGAVRFSRLAAPVNATAGG